MSDGFEKRPSGPGWVEIPTDVMGEIPDQTSAWQHGDTCVVSSFYADRMCWYISISNRGDAPSRGGVRKALKAFGMTAAVEDTRPAGGLRHFFLVMR